MLASGRGSNLGALIDAIATGRLAARIAGVYSDRASAPALALARAAGLHAESLAPRDYYDRLAFDSALFERIEAVKPGLIVCAGYMRLISAEVVEPRIGRMLNIHPSLLPAYQGLDTHARVLRAGDRRHGASVHFVTPELDAGPVLAQVAMAVGPGDDAAALAARLLPLEHRLLVASLALLTRRRAVPTPFGVALDDVLLDAPLMLAADDTLRTRDGHVA